MHPISSEAVVLELRKHGFGIIGTVSKDGRPHATGVVYVASPKGKPLVLYVVTDSGTKKVRNILANPSVSFVVPIPRRLLTIAPMSCIQFQGRARVLDAGDASARESMASSRMGKMVLEMAGEVKPEASVKPCFIEIIPDPVICTYGVGVSLMEMRKGSAGGRVRLAEQKAV